MRLEGGRQGQPTGRPLWSLVPLLLHKAFYLMLFFGAWHSVSHRDTAKDKRDKDPRPHGIYILVERN